MMARRIGVVTALFIAASVTAGAAKVLVRHNVSVTANSHDDNDVGPDSARVVSLLTAVGVADPLVCELIGDQLGNFWTSGNEDGVGRFADAQLALGLVKDSLHGRVTQPGAIAVLVQSLSADNACTRRVGAKLLGRSRIETARLTQLLVNNSSRIKEAAAYAIGVGDHYHPTARASLEQVLKSGAVNEAAMAAWALGQLEDSASTEALVQALRSNETRVRLAVVDALGNIDEDLRSLKDLERVLKSDASAQVRARAADAIGQLGQLSSSNALAAAVSDASPNVRYAAVEAIGQLHDIEKAPDALVKATQSSDLRLRRRAAMTLSEIHDPSTVDALIALIGDEDREVRLKVAEALGEIGSTKASSGLLRLLKDADAEVRRAAAEALGEIKDGH